MTGGRHDRNQSPADRQRSHPTRGVRRRVAAARHRGRSGHVDRRLRGDRVVWAGLSGQGAGRAVDERLVRRRRHRRRLGDHVIGGGRRHADRRVALRVHVEGRTRRLRRLPRSHDSTRAALRTSASTRPPLRSTTGPEPGATKFGSVDAAPAMASRSWVIRCCGFSLVHQGEPQAAGISPERAPGTDRISRSARGFSSAHRGRTAQSQDIRYRRPRTGWDIPALSVLPSCTEGERAILEISPEAARLAAAERDHGTSADRSTDPG